jgi:hypothetical protein
MALKKNEKLKLEIAKELGLLEKYKRMDGKALARKKPGVSADCCQSEKN